MTTVRLATPDDLDIVCLLDAATASRPWSRTALEDSLRDPRTSVDLVFDDEPVGYIITQVVVDEAEIHALGVLSSHRRRGLARLLLDTCHARWRFQSVAAGWLEVRADNPAAVALYKSAGWRMEGTRRDYYGPGITAILMRWSP